jgi:hypothetical protein
VIEKGKDLQQPGNVAAFKKSILREYNQPFEAENEPLLTTNNSKKIGTKNLHS